ncbi:hypothetical protein KP509_25G020700 [Ceratopteris richardii]|uniref:F-box domain-containing protein n=1 Tax=Ceratopteris richardii TaxID=49495 RepID=A0A8T2RR76_CERRI|nr:hypothetical protein KP509_25G020700 [Ceratopteris richardii]
MNSSLQLGPLFPLWLALAVVCNLLTFKDKLNSLMAMRLRRKHKIQSNAEEDVDDSASSTLLDLPDLPIDIILSKLSPQTLAVAASVCKELREKCSADHMWQPHVQGKWGAIAGDSAFEEWKHNCKGLTNSHVNPSRSEDPSPPCKSRIIWPLSCMWSPWEKSPAYLPQKMDGISNAYMKWYATLETGTYWFSAQIYNREHGHAGFLLSCYDAELCYDRQTDTFKARYPPHGSCSPFLEEGISWDRVRKPPVSTTAHELYRSFSLKDLRPDDHIEVQWRRNKRFPYGWWYGVVGHLTVCDKDSRYCNCHLDDMVWLEFNQYPPESRWRRTGLQRNMHTEKGDDTEGFYAGVRKLSLDEASSWMRMWPTEPLE